MSLTEDGGMVLPVAPMGGYFNGNGGNNGGFGGEWGAWVLIFLILAMAGGWGNNNGGGFGGGGGNYGNGFPWILNGQNGTNEIVSNGFQNAQLANQLTGIQGAVTSGFGDVSTQLCSGFAGVNATVNGAQNALSQQMYTNQIANLERSFAAQTASTQGMSALQSQFADCCCENRISNCQTQNLIQNEGSATRFADLNNTRDIIQSQTNGVQAILDKLCALELDGYKRENDNLRQQLNMATLSASQTAQTAEIQRGQVAEVDALYNRLSTCPVPSMPVYGSQPIFTCPNNNYNNGCGCGCGM